MILGVSLTPKSFHVSARGVRNPTQDKQQDTYDPNKGRYLCVVRCVVTLVNSVNSSFRLKANRG